jgi:hypothetical protein
MCPFSPALSLPPHPAVSRKSEPPARCGSRSAIWKPKSSGCRLRDGVLQDKKLSLPFSEIGDLGQVLVTPILSFGCMPHPLSAYRRQPVKLPMSIRFFDIQQGLDRGGNEVQTPPFPTFPYEEKDPIFPKCLILFQE